MSSEEGWEGLDQAQTEPQKADDLDILYGGLFKSQEGQKVLSHLRHITIEQPSWYPGEDPSQGYFREGAADLVRLIIKRVERSDNV
jgi:hypothetical protein|tara:strand:- start:225 stop:482 length:258 start_codon:yes stop_codon:yes gene_type:complete